MKSSQTLALFAGALVSLSVVLVLLVFSDSSFLVLDKGRSQIKNERLQSYIVTELEQASIPLEGSPGSALEIEQKVIIPEVLEPTENLNISFLNRRTPSDLLTHERQKPIKGNAYSLAQQTTKIF